MAHSSALAGFRFRDFAGRAVRQGGFAMALLLGFALAAPQLTANVQASEGSAKPANVKDKPAKVKELRFEDYFRGRTYAYGRFKAINGVDRAFRVELTGRWNGKVLTLREDFAYEDGERDVKTWTFEKTGPGAYLGRRDDVQGVAEVKVSGNRADYGYDVDIGKKNSPFIVHFADTLILQDDDTLRNTAKVSKFFIPIADVWVNFARSEKKARAIKP